MLYIIFNLLLYCFLQFKTCHHGEEEEESVIGHEESNKTEGSRDKRLIMFNTVYEVSCENCLPYFDILCLLHWIDFLQSKIYSCTS